MKTPLITLGLLAALSCPAQTNLTAQDALAIAAKNRPALRAARLRVEQARSGARALGTPPPLTLGLGASSRAEVGATDGDLFLSQPVDVFGRVSAQRKAGGAAIRLALADYAKSAAELQSDVLSAYVEAVAAQHRKQVAADLLKIAESLFAATKRRFEEGKVAEMQLTRASIELARAEQAASLWRAASEAALKRLSGELGVEETLAVEPDAALAPFSGTGERPEVLALSAEVEAAEAEAGVARLGNRPELDVQLRRSAWNEGSAIYGARVQLTWALWDHGRSDQESKAARKKAEAARKQLDDAKARAKAELAATNVDLEAGQKQLTSYESILASAKDLVEKSQRAYTEGFGTQVDVLEATRALREVEQEFVEARLRLSQTVIAQYRAAGFLSEVLK